MKYAEVAENVKKLVENRACELGWSLGQQRSGNPPISAHHNLDLAVDRLYRSKPFTSDEERLEHLFKLYEEMTAKEKLV